MVGTCTIGFNSSFNAEVYRWPYIYMYKYKHKYVCIYDTKIILLSIFLSFSVDLNYFCTWKESTKTKIVNE